MNGIDFIFVGLWILVIGVSATSIYFGIEWIVKHARATLDARVAQPESTRFVAGE